MPPPRAPATRLHIRSAEAAALAEPGPSDFPASGRRECLKDLMLRNETVYVRGKNDGTKLYGTLCGNKIHTQANAILNRVQLEPAQFVAIAGHEVHSEQEACALIYLESGPNLADFVENGKSRKWNAAAVAACLEAQYSVYTMQDLSGLFQVCDVSVSGQTAWK